MNKWILKRRILQIKMVLSKVGGGLVHREHRF